MWKVELTMSKLLNKLSHSRAWYCYGKVFLDVFQRFRNPFLSPFHRSSPLFCQAIRDAHPKEYTIH